MYTRAARGRQTAILAGALHEVLAGACTNRRWWGGSEKIVGLEGDRNSGAAFAGTQE
jgi:hypothetical protein